MRSKWIFHKGKRILYCDFANFQVPDFEALKEELYAVESEILRHPENSVLLITDVSGSIASMDAVDAVQKSAARSKRCVRKNAVLGITGIKKILFDPVVRFSGHRSKMFEDLEKAKEWLVSAE